MEHKIFLEQLNNYFKNYLSTPDISKLMIFFTEKIELNICRLKFQKKLLREIWVGAMTRNLQDTIH